MATLTMALPDPMKDWIDMKVLSDGYDDAGDYVRDLIRRDQDRAAGIATLQVQVTEGLESGVSTRSADDIRRLSRELAAANGT